jgi:putative DNA methylase
MSSDCRAPWIIASNVSLVPSEPWPKVLPLTDSRRWGRGSLVRWKWSSRSAPVSASRRGVLAVAERTKYLFGGSDAAPRPKRSSKTKQMTLFAELEQAAEAQGWGDVGAPKAGATTLDRVHQAMLLFASGRSEALKRFLVQEGVGQGPLFWKLAQSFSALYPSGSDEKRWVDGVLARKKGLGFG